MRINLQGFVAGFLEKVAVWPPPGVQALHGPKQTGPAPVPGAFINAAEQEKRQAAKAKAEQKLTEHRARTTGQAGRTPQELARQTQAKAKPIVVGPAAQAAAPAVKAAPAAAATSAASNVGPLTGRKALMTPAGQHVMGEPVLKSPKPLERVDRSTGAIKSAPARPGTHGGTIKMKGKVSDLPAYTGPVRRPTKHSIRADVGKGAFKRKGGLRKFFGKHWKTGLVGAGGLALGALGSKLLSKESSVRYDEKLVEEHLRYKDPNDSAESAKGGEKNVSLVEAMIGKSKLEKKATGCGLAKTKKHKKLLKKK